MPFADRREAGRRLGAELTTRTYPDPLVLRLPRGAAPVAFEVARRWTPLRMADASSWSWTTSSSAQRRGEEGRWLWMSGR